MPGEFDLIARHFTRPARNVVLGIGDDCALVRAPDGLALAISTDMLVAGTHFFVDADPHAASFYASCGARLGGAVAAPIPGEPTRMRPQFQFEFVAGAAHRRGP